MRIRSPCAIMVQGGMQVKRIGTTPRRTVTERRAPLQRSIFIALR